MTRRIAERTPDQIKADWGMSQNDSLTYCVTCLTSFAADLDAIVAHNRTWRHSFMWTSFNKWSVAKNAEASMAYGVRGHDVEIQCQANPTRYHVYYSSTVEVDGERTTFATVNAHRRLLAGDIKLLNSLGFYACPDAHTAEEDSPEHHEDDDDCLIKPVLCDRCGTTMDESEAVKVQEAHDGDEPKYMCPYCCDKVAEEAAEEAHERDRPRRELEAAIRDEIYETWPSPPKMVVDAMVKKAMRPPDAELIENEIRQLQSNQQGGRK